MGSRSKNRILLCVLCSAMLFLLSGCWDRLEIDQRAIVLGIAIDLAGEHTGGEQESEIAHPHGSFPIPDEEMIRVTAQIAVPDRIPLGSQQGGDSSGESPVWVLSAIGHTIDEALHTMQQELAFRIFLGHMRVVIISEEFAKLGIDNINDYLRRNPEVRRLAWMAVSKGDADQLMKASPKLDQIPSLYITDMLEQSVVQGKYPEEFIGRFWSKESSIGQDAHLPYIELKAAENIAISGMACFRNEKLVGTTKPMEIGVFMSLTNEPIGGYAAYSKLPETNVTVMFQPTRRIARTKVHIINGRPHIRIYEQIEGDLEEKSAEKAFQMKDHDTIHQLEKMLNEKGTKSQQEFVAKMQNWKTDVFGFGELVRAKEPKFWKEEVGTIAKWEEYFATLPVEIHLEFKIRRIGMKSS